MVVGAIHNFNMLYLSAYIAFVLNFLERTNNEHTAFNLCKFYIMIASLEKCICLLVYVLCR